VQLISLTAFGSQRELGGVKHKAFTWMP